MPDIDLTTAASQLAEEAGIGLAQKTVGRAWEWANTGRDKASLEDLTRNLAVAAQRLQQALKTRRIRRPGRGRWVEYVLPDRRRVYVESNTRMLRLGSAPDNVTARVIIKPGATEYTNYLKTLIFQGQVLVRGDLHDVVRTADKVGFEVEDPELEHAGVDTDNQPLVVRAVSEIKNNRL